MTINTPYSGQAFSTSTITITGTATDAGGPGLNYVIIANGANGTSGYQLFSGGPASASFSISTVTLDQGSNVIGVKAYDTAGLCSTLAVVTVTYAPPNGPIARPGTRLSGKRAGEYFHDGRVFLGPGTRQQRLPDYRFFTPLRPACRHGRE